jgi:hypothetical protein
MGAGISRGRRVELVLVRSEEVDRYGAEIFKRASVLEVGLDHELADLNARVERGFTWRPARSFPDPGHYCPSCGATLCWCGVRRLISRRDAA